jgi:hypothetical protein
VLIGLGLDPRVHFDQATSLGHALSAWIVWLSFGRWVNVYIAQYAVAGATRSPGSVCHCGRHCSACVGSVDRRHPVQATGAPGMRGAEVHLGHPAAGCHRLRWEVNAEIAVDDRCAAVVDLVIAVCEARPARSRGG